jgi:hypothetical protein
MAVFEAMLMMRYVPGWVLDGSIPVDVEEADAEAEEAVLDMVEEAELDWCCGDVDAFLFLCAAESPPPTPPPIAAPNSTSTTANIIQNKRVESLHVRCDGFVASSSLAYVGGLEPECSYAISSLTAGDATSRPGWSLVSGISPFIVRAFM